MILIPKKLNNEAVIKLIKNESNRMIDQLIDSKNTTNQIDILCLKKLP